MLSGMMTQICHRIKRKHTNANSQQAQNIFIAFVQRRHNVLDLGPALYKCYTHVLCLLGCVQTFLSLPNHSNGSRMRARRETRTFQNCYTLSRVEVVFESLPQSDLTTRKERLTNRGASFCRGSIVGGLVQPA